MFQAYLAQAAAAARRCRNPIAPSGSGATGGDTSPTAAWRRNGLPDSGRDQGLLQALSNQKPGDVGFVTDKERAEFGSEVEAPRAGR